jgi:hypothetical protein
MRLVVLNAILLAAIALAVVRTQLALRDESAVEASVRRYAVALSSSDLDGAMAEIAPDQRADWADWVRGQLGNIYEVRGIAVRSPDLLERITRGEALEPLEVTVVLDVNRGYPAEFYQPTTRVPVEIVNGRPYLAAPLLSAS